MTIAAVSAGQTIDPAWGNSVADQLNSLGDFKIARGVTSVSLDAGGLGTITFPFTFGSTPSVTLTVQLSTGSQRTAQINSISTSSVDVRCYNGGTAEASTNRTVHWIAIGVA